MRAARGALARLRGGGGGIIIGWLLRLVFLLALFGFALFEAGAIVFARVSVDRIAVDAASEAGLEYGKRSSTSKAAEAAAKFAERNDAELVDFEVHPERGTVTVTIRKEAKTVVVHRIGFKRFAVVESTHAGRIR